MNESKIVSARVNSSIKIVSLKFYEIPIMFMIVKPEIAKFECNMIVKVYQMEEII